MHGGFELVPEIGDRGRDGGRRPVTKCAEGPAEDVLTEVEQLFDVTLLTLARLHALQDLHQPPGAFSAGRALPTGLMLVELGPPQHRTNDRSGLVEALQCLGAKHRFHCGDALVVQSDVEMLGRQHWRGGAPRRPELELVALAHATGQVEQLAQGDPERRLELSRVDHMTGERIDRHALGLLGTHRSEPVRAAVEDAWDRRDGLDVVDLRGAGVQTGDRRKRRTESGLATTTLERIQQRRFFTADICPRAGVHDYLQVVAGTQDVLPGIARGVSLADRLLQASHHVQHFATDVDERVIAANRIRRDDHALDQRVRAGQHQRNVLAGARLGFVGVDHQVLGLGVVLRDEAPFHASGKAGTATATQARVLDHGHHVAGVHIQRLAQGAVPAAPLVVGELPGALVAPVLGENWGQQAVICGWCRVVAGQGVAQRPSSWASGWACGFGTGGADQPCSRAIRSPSNADGADVGPSSARPSGKPASTRSACFQVHTLAPRVAVTSSPARVASTTSITISCIVFSKNSQLIIITGARSHAALHSMCSKVILPSAVVSSLPISRWSFSAAKTSSPPTIAHRAVVQTPTWYSPTGRRLYIV